MESDRILKSFRDINSLSNSTFFANHDTITFHPKQVIFQNIRPHEKYQIFAHIRNETKESQKIRIIHKKNPFFKLNEETCQKTIAPGLSLRISVMFNLNEKKQMENNIYDQVIVLGKSFKKVLPLRGILFKHQLQFPEVFKLGTVKLGKEYRFQIPIKNKGENSCEVQVFQVSTPNIQVNNSMFHIQSERMHHLNFKVTFRKLGIIKESIEFKDGSKIFIRGICIDEKIQLCSSTGERLMSRDFGLIYIGEVIQQKFYILNNSPHKVTCLARTFNKSVFDITNIEIDEKRGNFIIKQTPAAFTKEKEGISSHIMDEKFEVQPFSDYECSLIIEKKPSQKQIEHFSSNISQKKKKGQTDIVYPHSQMTQVLYCKVLMEDKAYSIPIKFTPIMPKLLITEKTFNFYNVEARQTEKKMLLIKNLNERSLTLEFSKSKNFYIVGNATLEGMEERQYQICFRPLVKGKFKESIMVSIFGIWSIQLKVSGFCDNAKNYSLKTTRKEEQKNTSFNFPLSKNLINTTATNFLSLERAKREDRKIKNLARTKLEDIKNRVEDDQIPFNPFFEANEIPRLSERNFHTMRPIKSQLFFKKQEYNLTITEKKNSNSKTFQRMNLKELSKHKNLTSEELSRIQILTDKIEFGHVFINSVSQKQFVVRNQNEDKPILLELDFYNNQSLIETKKEIKRIEPLSEGKFTINLKPMKLGQIKIPLGYIINQKYIFQVTITANVTLVNLELSTKNINFYFSENDLSFEKSAILTIHNHGNTPTKFVFVQSTIKSFSIFAKGDQIMPHSSIQAQITYQPIEGNDSGTKRVQVDKIIMKVIGGAEDVIKCVGSVNQPKCSVKQGEIYMGDVLISTLNQNKLTLRNHSKVESVVKVELEPMSLSQNIRFDSKLFWLSSEEKKEIVFHFQCHEVKTIKGIIKINVRGGKTFKVPVYANFVYPQIEMINEECLDFGKIPILKNLGERQIILKNKTKCEIKLELNNFNKDKEEYFLEITAAREENIEIAYQKEVERNESLTASKKNTINFAILDKEFEDKNKKLNELSILKIIKLLPMESSTFYIKFIPKLIKKYDLKIPLFLHKATRLLEPIEKKIRCEGIKPIIYINPPIIQFQNSIILENRQCYKKQIEIVNPHNKVTKWNIDGKKDLYSIFYFSVYSGELKANEKTSIDVYFRPIKEGRENKKFFIYLDEQHTSFSSFELEIVGNAVLPTLKFVTNEVILPVVPLYIESRTIVQIQNEGYDTITLSKWKLSSNFQHTEMKVNFIEGKLLSLAKKTLKIQVCFYSEVPISLTTTLELYDEFGEKYTIPVSATAQNSIFTVYPFLQNDSNYSIVYDSNEAVIKVLICKSKSFEANLSITGKSLMASNFIKKWCNYELNMNIQNFPDCIIDSDGELLSQLFVKITNGRHLIKKIHCLSDQKICRVLELHSYYSEVIRVLQTQGAFLNHIRPQFLLSTEDYLMFTTHKKMQINREQNFEVISHESWTALFYQMCKLYVEPQLSQRGLMRISKGKEEEAWKVHGSTLYSDYELSLLGYLNTFSTEQKIYNFNDTGKILELLQRMIEKTFEISLMEALSKSKATGQTIQESMISVTKFLHLHMKELGLSLYLQSHDLLSMGPKELILYFVSLLNTLCYYQTVTVVNFETSLGEKISRGMELQNPSSLKKIKYWIKLIGSQNFHSDLKYITLEPRQKKEVVITYHSKISRHESAKLVLVPTRDDDGIAAAQPLCFNLKATLITKLVIKKLNITASMYEIIPISIQIQLPLSICTAEFSLLLNEADEDQANFCPSFFLLSQEKRIVNMGKDKLELKFTSLTMGKKFCKIIYSSPVIGEYIYELYANVVEPLPLKDIKTKSIKTNKEEIIEINVPKENIALQQCLTFIRQTIKGNQCHKRSYWSHLFPTIKKKGKKEYKYSVSLSNTGELELTSNSIVAEEVEKSNSLGMNFQKIQLHSFFKKPFRQFLSTLQLRNQQLHDVRIYKIITTVVMKPKIINLNYTTKARDPLKQPFPLKVLPSSITYSKICPYFTIENLAPEQSGRCDYVARFRPEWIIDEEISVVVEYKDSLQQIIYRIKLTAAEPKPFKEVFIKGSELFETQIEIDMCSFLSDNGIIQELLVKSNIKRKHEICAKYKGQKSIKLTLHPYPDNETAFVRFLKPQSQQYYEIILHIKNKDVRNLGNVSLNTSINQVKKYCVHEVCPNQPNFQVKYKKQYWLSHQIVASQSKHEFYIIFSPSKELEQLKSFYFSVGHQQYKLLVELSVPKLPEVTFPQVITENTVSKAIIIPITNISSYDGKYSLEIQSDGPFKLEYEKLDMKKKQKSVIKVFFQPQYIGQSSKAMLTLKSEILPELTYLLVGSSYFKRQEELLEFECLSQNQIVKNIQFFNQFSKKERFKIQIEPDDCQYRIQGEKMIQVQIKPSQSYNFEVKCKFGQNKEEDQENARIVISKAFDKKVVKVINLKLLLVKKFQNKVYSWSCKARQTLFETVNISNKQALIDVETAPEIKKYLTFTTEQKNQGEVKIKFSPLKPIKKKKYNLIFSTEDCKYRVNCIIHVLQPQIDDIIKIRTDQIHEVGMVNFKLTNITKQNAFFKAYFEKGNPELHVQPTSGMLQPYGRIGTNICIKFSSDVYNKKVDDKLIIETEDMYWLFKVRGTQSKILKY